MNKPQQLFTYSYSAAVTGAFSVVRSIDAQLAAVNRYWDANRLPEWADLSSDGYRAGDFVDEDPTARQRPLSQRPEGGRLLNILNPGDHVLVQSVGAAFPNSRHWHEAIDAWSKGGVTSHFIENGFVIRPGDDFITDARTFVEWESEIRARRKALTAAGVHQNPNRQRWAIRIRTSDCPPRPPSIFPYFRWGLMCRLAGDDSPLDQDASVRTAAKWIQRRDPRAWIAPPTIDDMEKTLDSRFFDRPAGRELLRRAAPGDHVIIYDIASVFRSASDLTSTVRRFHQRGATLHVADRFFSSTAPESLRMFNSFGRLCGGRIQSGFPILNGYETERLPAYLLRTVVGGKTVGVIDEAILKIARVARRLVQTKKPDDEILARLEELDSARFSDGIQIPPAGILLNSPLAARLDPGHGVDATAWGQRRMPRWSADELDRMREKSYWKAMDRAVREQGF